MARAQHVDQIVRPALAAGTVVLCDRFGDSTLAYQGYGHGQPIAPLRALIQYATGNLRPHLTFYLDVDAEVGCAASSPTQWNRMEAHALAFHEAARGGYQTLAAEDPALGSCSMAHCQSRRFTRQFRRACCTSLR